MNDYAEFYSEITGETYYTSGPFWQDGIPEEAWDAIQDAIEYTRHMQDYGRAPGEIDSNLLDVVDFIEKNT